MPSLSALRLTRQHLVLALLGLFLAAFAGWFLLQNVSVAQIKDGMNMVTTWCASVHPLVFVLGFAILPYFGIPSSLLYLAAAAAYGQKSGGSWWSPLIWSWLGLALNIAFGYVIGAQWLRGPITRWLGRRNLRLPEVPPGEIWRLVILTRVLPGPPLIVQNLLLAVAGIPFRPYFCYSLPPQMLFATGFVVAGDALFKGDSGLLIVGICVIVAMTLLAHIAKTMYNTRRARDAAQQTPTSDETPGPDSGA